MSRSAFTTLASREASRRRLVDLSRAGPGFEARSVVVVPGVISEEEAAGLVKDCETSLRRRRYQSNHWDSVIERYREVEKLTWEAKNQQTLSRIRCLIQDHTNGGRPVNFLPVHVIDLASDGYIKPHVDSIKFSGGFVAGLSLLSSCVMRLQGEEDPSSVVDLLLEPHSLYILQGQARYGYNHSILEGGMAEANSFAGEPVARDRRLSLIFRDEHPNEEAKRRTRPGAAPCNQQ